MKLKTLGYSRSIGRTEITKFAASYPCHGISDKVHRIVFRWDGDGNLVDLVATSRSGKTLDASHYDGAGIAALCADVQREMHPEHAR